MLTTKRKPAGVGEILTEEFLAPMDLTQSVLAEAMGVPRKHAAGYPDLRQGAVGLVPADLGRHGEREGLPGADE